MLTIARLAALSLALVLVTGCMMEPSAQAPLPTAAKKTTSTATIAKANLTGQVMGPPGFTSANMVAAGGGNMVAAGGGNMVAAGGGNMVAAGGGNYVLLASEEVPLANAWVQLVNKQGEPVANIEPVQADAEGNFTFKNVPTKKTYVVQAVVQTAGQKQAKLRSLAQADGTNKAQLSAASTCVAVSLLAGLQGDEVGNVDAKKFKAAIDATRANLSAEKWPDLSDPEAITGTMKRLNDSFSELSAALDALGVNFGALVKKATDDASRAVDDASKAAEDASKPAEDASKAAEDASQKAEDARKKAEDALKGMFGGN